MVAAQTATLLRPSVSTNDPVVEVGETLRATAGLDNPGMSGETDIFLGLFVPGGTIAFFTSTGGIALGNVDDLASFQPIATAVPLSTPFSVAPVNFFTYRWTGAEPHGSYVFFLLAVKAGALGNGKLSSDEILGLATSTFSFP